MIHLILAASFSLLTQSPHLCHIETDDPLVEKSLEQFVGQPITPELIAQIKRSLPTYEVHIPDQDISEGNLIVHTKPMEIQKIQWVGQKWFSQSVLAKGVRASVGAPFNPEEIESDIAWMNRNPFHQSQVLLSKDNGENTLTFQTNDRFPLRIYAGADNTGTTPTSETRLMTGVTWGNAFFRGDLLTAEVSCAPDFNLFSSYYANYTAFLPWRHLLIIYGGYAHINPHIQGFKSSGKAAQGSVRYAIPFLKGHEFSVGFDLKNTNSNLFFVDETDYIPVLTHTVNLTQWSLGYVYTYKELTLDWQIYFSPFQWLPNQHFQDLQPGANNQYLYSRLALANEWRLPKKWKLSCMLRLQGSTGTLLPSEQYGLGGYSTVRGYDEREFNADNALNANVELRAPALHVFKRDELTFLAFCDFGWGWQYHPSLTEKHSEMLVSAGPGVRYLIRPYLSARADYGFILNRIHLGENKIGKFQLGLTVGY